MMTKLDTQPASAPGLFAQAAAVVRIGVRGLARRWWSSLNAALATAVVVGVLVALLAIGAGYAQSLKLASADDNVMILRAGARSEMESSLTGQQVSLIARAAPLARSSRGAAAEVYAIANIDGADGASANVAVRGLVPASLALRPDTRIAEGRMFAPGRRELVVGRLAQRRFPGLEVGKTLAFAGGGWKIVGAFEASGVASSEMWADAPMIQAAYSRGDNYSLVLAPTPPGLTATALENALNRDPRLNVRVMSQADYYAEQAEAMQDFVGTLGLGIGALMALGAIFASLNTGFAHVRARAKELATLAAIGWSERALVIAVAVESLTLNLLGAIAGAGAAALLFDGRVISTLFHSKDFAQVVFAFAVTDAVLVQAALVALVIGAIGMVGPSLSVRRIAIARVLAHRR